MCSRGPDISLQDIQMTFLPEAKTNLWRRNKCCLSKGEKQKAFLDDRNASSTNFGIFGNLVCDAFGTSVPNPKLTTIAREDTHFEREVTQRRMGGNGSHDLYNVSSRNGPLGQSTAQLTLTAISLFISCRREDTHAKAWLYSTYEVIYHRFPIKSSYC